MAELLDNKDEQGVPPLPGGYVAIKKESQGTPPLPSGYVVKKKRVFRTHFTRRCWGISYENYSARYFFGYRATNKGAGFGYFRWSN